MEARKVFQIDSSCSRQDMFDDIYICAKNELEAIEKWNSFLPEKDRIKIPDVYSTNDRWSLSVNMSGNIHNEDDLLIKQIAEGWKNCGYSDLNYKGNGLKENPYPEAKNIVLIDEHGSIYYYKTFPYVFRMFRQPKESKHSDIVYVETSILSSYNRFASNRDISIQDELGHVTREVMMSKKKGMNMWSSRNKKGASKPSLSILYLDDRFERFKKQEDTSKDIAS